MKIDWDKFQDVYKEYITTPICELRKYDSMTDFFKANEERFHVEEVKNDN